MKSCVMCGKESDDLDFLERCEPCFREYVNTPDYLKPHALFVTTQLKDGKTLTRAHYKDILSREAQPDGRVIRKHKYTGI